MVPVADGHVEGVRQLLHLADDVVGRPLDLPPEALLAAEVLPHEAVVVPGHDLPHVLPRLVDQRHHVAPGPPFSALEDLSKIYTQVY